MIDFDCAPLFWFFIMSNIRVKYLMFSRKKNVNPYFTNVSQLKKKLVVYYLYQKAVFLSFDHVNFFFMTNIMYVLYTSETEEHWRN